MPAGLTDFTNSLTLTEVDKTQYQGQPREDHAKMYIPVLVKDARGSSGRSSITMALLDSGNLLARAAVEADFHALMGISVKNTVIKARAANRQAMDVKGVSKGIYIHFPNITRTFLVKPLVVQNLPCDINLGAQFNFVTGLTPQKVVQDRNGRRSNFCELEGVKIQLQFQDVSNETLRHTIENP